MTPSTTKHPLFTTKLFSTKSFGPGHVVGTGILVVGTIAIARALIARVDSQKLAARENERGEYGARSKARTP